MQKKTEDEEVLDMTKEAFKLATTAVNLDKLNNPLGAIDYYVSEI